MIALDFDCGTRSLLAVDKYARRPGRCLAPTAQYSFGACGIAPGPVRLSCASAESAIHAMARMMIELVPELNRAFSACLPDRLNPGATPQADVNQRLQRSKHVRSALF
jgi:hypothetical protein